MSKTAMMVCLGSLVATSAHADPKEGHAMQFEVGVNTRHFSGESAATGTAFRSTTGESIEPSAEAGTALTTSLRFTGRGAYNLFLGVEGEVGELMGIAGSNIAGAYGVFGWGGNLGLLRIAGELVTGPRWVRYDTPMRSDPSVFIAEPRIRADVWISPQVTLGAAAGATLGDDTSWMAGVYIGVHSFEYDRK
jgi:hypothetical protein